MENLGEKVEDIIEEEESKGTEENQVMNHVAIKEALAILKEQNPRLAEVIERRYFNEEPLRELATNLKVSAQRIAQLEKAGLAKLKKILGGGASATPKNGENIEQNIVLESMTPEKSSALEKISFDLFICFKTKKFNTVIIDFSPEFYKMDQGKMQSHINTYKNRDLPENQNEEFRKKVKEAEIEIEKLTGFSAKDLLLKKQQLEIEYNSGKISETKLAQLMKIQSD